MLIDDHINLMGANPLMGINDDRLGPRFPDMCEPYGHKLIDRALEVARRENIVAHRGVFVAVAGPNLETRAEYRFLRMIGADVVGMSTVPEVLVAVHCGLKVVFGLRFSLTAFWSASSASLTSVSRAIRYFWIERSFRNSSFRVSRIQSEE